MTHLQAKSVGEESVAEIVRVVAHLYLWFYVMTHAPRTAGVVLVRSGGGGKFGVVKSRTSGEIQ